MLARVKLLSRASIRYSSAEWAGRFTGCVLPCPSLTYVRDGSPVRIDWNDDGDREHAGRADEVSLSVRTAVVVVVPPGGQGVGDTDGNADERSAGWSAVRSTSIANGSVAPLRDTVPEKAARNAPAGH